MVSTWKPLFTWMPILMIAPLMESDVGSKVSASSLSTQKQSGAVRKQQAAIAWPRMSIYVFRMAIKFRSSRFKMMVGLGAQSTVKKVQKQRDGFLTPV